MCRHTDENEAYEKTIIGERMIGENRDRSPD